MLERAKRQGRRQYMHVWVWEHAPLGKMCNIRCREITSETIPLYLCTGKYTDTGEWPAFWAPMLHANITQNLLYIYIVRNFCNTKAQ